MKYPSVKRSISRFIYLPFLLFLILGDINILIHFPEYMNEVSTLGVRRWVVDSICILILLYQFIFNNRIGWFLMAGFIFYTFIMFLRWCFLKDFEMIPFVFLFYIIVYLLFIMLYPSKHISKESNNF